MREAATYAIETRGLHKRFGSNHILRGADLRITDGTAAAVLGPSGTGKSALIKPRRQCLPSKGSRGPFPGPRVPLGRIATEGKRRTT